jgi:hypothetical protein
MDNEFAQQIYYIIQGFIDAKDDRGRSVNGTFVALASRRDIKYTSVLFGNVEENKSLSWSELLPLHEEAAKDEGRDPLLMHHEEGLLKFLRTSLLLSNVAKNLNAKPAEQAISRFCLEHLKLKSVCFVKFFAATEEDIAQFEKDKPEQTNEADIKSEPPFPEDPYIHDQDVENRPENGGKNSRELFIRCDPVLDPIRGVAMNELAVGDNVYGRLPSDSVIYKLLAKNNSKFDGTVTAKVSGILLNDLGTATVSLTLSDGIAGVMKLSGKVKVKIANEAKGDGKSAAGGKKLTFDLSALIFQPEFIFAAAGILVVLAALFILYYIFPL